MKKFIPLFTIIALLISCTNRRWRGFVIRANVAILLSPKYNKSFSNNYV